MFLVTMNYGSEESPQTPGDLDIVEFYLKHKIELHSSCLPTYVHVIAFLPYI